MIRKDFTRKIDEFKTKSNEEKLKFLSAFWGGDIQQTPFKLIGTYEKSDKPDKNGKEYGFFTNVRNMNGDILYYPFNLGQVRIWVEHKENLTKQDFWQFEVDFNKRIDKNPFQLNLTNRTFGSPKNTFMDKVEKENFIRKIFKETGATPRDAKNLANALKNVTGDLYTETERFIFELLQNADDIPNERGEVDVKFSLLKENLLFLHNGKPFDNNDVESISSIGDSTKRKDTEKTGYKGIGFKSVFTDAETVLINSGNFSFSFDKNSPLYNDLFTEEIPWEIKPIWTEVYRYPREVRDNEDFFKYPVAIDLEVGDSKINSYKIQVSKLFSEPRFILFLRNVKCIEVQGIDNAIKIQKRKKDDKFELSNNDILVHDWIINDFDFSVTQDIRDAMTNDKLVPPKLKEIKKSKLSFACQIKDDKIISILPDQSYLFTYLPTNVNDYKFPFLVNADFLTTANRQSIHVKNPWNLYLFEQIGYLCFQWIAQIAVIEELKTSITNLIPSRYDNSNESIIHSHFNSGFDKAISEIAFLPAQNDGLSKVSDAIIDITGFTDLLNDKLFIGTIYENKILIINDLSDKEKLSVLDGITIFGKEELKQVFASSNFSTLTNLKELLQIIERNKEKGFDSCDIRDIIECVSLETLNSWIKSCDTETYDAFLKELEESNLREKTKERIRQIKLFQFSNGNHFSFSEIVSNKDNYGRLVTPTYRYSNVVISNHKTDAIKNVLQKLGFVTSNLLISEYPNIYSVIQMPAEKILYGYIADKCKTNTLTTEEKKKLFLNFTNEHTKFTDIGDATLKDLCLFTNANKTESQIKPLKELISSALQTPEWLQDWVIKSDEYFVELKPYLISESDIYPNIILQNWNTLISQTSEIKSLYEKTIYYYGLKETNVSIWKKSDCNFVYTKDGFTTANKVFFNSKMSGLENAYIDFQNAILSLFSFPAPEKSTVNYLLKEPFRIDGSDFSGRRFNKTQLDINEIKAVVKFCKLNNELFFKHCIIEKKGNEFYLIEKTAEKSQITSPDERARKFIEKNCSEKLFVLPSEFLEFKEEDGIVSANDLHSKIIDCVNVNDFKEELVDIVKYRAKLQFLQLLTEIRLYADKNYTKESYEYKVLELACVEIQGSEIQHFMNKIVVQTENSVLSLSEIPPFADKIEIGGIELLLSKILPDNYNNSSILSKLLEQFVDLGLQQEKINTLFGIETEPEPETIFEYFSDKIKLLENEQQLAFLLLYDKEIETVDFEKFEVETYDGKYHLGYSYFINNYPFIQDNAILAEKYQNISKLLTLPIKADKETEILKQPYFSEDEFICPYIIEDMSDEQKETFLDFLYDHWGNHKKKSIIKEIDWSKINGIETDKLLGFNPRKAVYPNTYAYSEEQLPDFCIKWLSDNEQKGQFILDLGVWTENSVIVELRKFLSGNLDTFNKVRLSQNKRFNDDETVLFNTFKWIMENEIDIKFEEQFDIFKKIIEVINDNPNSNNISIKEEYDVELLEKESEKWENTTSFTICNYEDKMPVLVKLEKFDNFIFYRYNDDDFMVYENTIYLNKNLDKKNVLHKVASSEDNDFSFEDLWALFGDTARTDNLNQVNIPEGMDKENASDILEITKGYTPEQIKEALENLKQLSPEKIEQIIKTTIPSISYSEVQKVGDAILQAGGSNGLSKQQQIAENQEAKEVVKQHLNSLGFTFPNGIDGFSTTFVEKENKRYPIVIKSYKKQDEDFHIGANEWIHLMKPNAMLWASFGNGKVGYINIFDLFRNQSQLSVSFSTENLDDENRLGKFADLLHYFKDIHFDFDSFNAPYRNTANKMEDYRFDTTQTEEDIIDNDSDIML